MSDLPPGWALSTLGEIGRYLNGRGFKKSEWRGFGRPIIRIQNLTGSGSHFNYFDGEPEERYIARDGDLLVSWAATLGVFVWRGPEAVVNQHIFKVESFIERRFHRYLLQAMLAALERQTHGSGMVHITKSRFDSTPVAVPPLNEQRRIVAAIEEHLSRLDAADASLATTTKRLDVLQRSALASAMNGGWPRQRLGDVAQTQLGKMLSKKSKTGVGSRPYLRNKNVHWGRIDTDDLLTMDFSEREAEKFGLVSGDVLVCEGGEVGRAAIWRGQIDGCCFQKALHRVRSNGELLPEFIAYAFRWLSDANAFDPHVTGSTIKHLPQEDLRRIPVPVPPLDEQRRIVAEVEERLSRVDALRAAIERAQRRSAALRRAVLERAFRGELVPQDPSDEPAEALLARIRADQTMSDRANRRGRSQLRG